ncbi:MAG TPA: signal peptide peptidase SppA [Bacteroidales bacterium]|nr:signal peptide peptidase SppA [Bacteroidales bacterium]HRZ48922.1 signal peptide peptidase SppA [Bacteroidales bacterium]
MKEFFKMMFASMLGVMLSGLLLMLIMFIMFASIISFSSGDEVSVPDKALLHIKLDMSVVERAPKNPFEDFGGFGNERVMGLNQILGCLEKAASDDHIKGVLIDMGMLDAGPATVEEIRNALLQFRKSGKPVIAYGDMVPQRSYYLASAADKVYLNPLGSLEFTGLSAQMAFVRGLAEKLKVEMQIIRPEGNTYKSAVEPFYLDKMSEANRDQTGKYLRSGWDMMLSNLAESRKLSPEKLNALADSLTGFKAANAYEAGLVDGLMYRDQLIDSLKKVLDPKEKTAPNIITLARYSKAIRQNDPGKGSKGKSDGQIAVIYANGNIVMGEEEESVISATHISKTIRKARENKKIKAIVLRINSGGGDGLASEIIWREVELARKEKPVVVSMGDYAASGGYYIACAATRIVAQPNTLTGSIGVFGVMPNMQQMFREHLGITFDEVKTHQHSTFGSPLKPLDPYEYTMLKQYVEDFYNHFLQRVSEGRNMTVAQVDSIGQGRIWAGTDALQIGLVDTLGGLDVAVKIAAAEAKLKNYKTVDLPHQTDPFMRLMKQLSGEASVQQAIRESLGVNYAFYEMLTSLGELKGIQARLPFVMTMN